jgi:hypothetical protein
MLSFSVRTFTLALGPASQDRRPSPTVFSNLSYPYWNEEKSAPQSPREQDYWRSLLPMCKCLVVEW